MSTKSRRPAPRVLAQHERPAAYRRSMALAAAADRWLADNDPDYGAESWAETTGLAILPTHDERPNTLLGGATWQARQVIHALGADLPALEGVTLGGAPYVLDAEAPSFDHVTQHHRLHADAGRPRTRVLHRDACPVPCPQALVLALVRMMGHKGRSHTCLSEGRTYVRSARPVSDGGRTTSGRQKAVRWARDGHWSDARYMAWESYDWQGLDRFTNVIGAYRSTRAVVTTRPKRSTLTGDGADCIPRVGEVAEITWQDYAAGFETFPAPWARPVMVRPVARKAGRPKVPIVRSDNSAAYVSASRQTIARRVMETAEGREWTSTILHAIELSAATEGRSVSLGHRVSVDIAADGTVRILQVANDDNATRPDPVPASRVIAEGSWKARTRLARLAAALLV